MQPPVLTHELESILEVHRAVRNFGLTPALFAVFSVPFTPANMRRLSAIEEKIKTFHREHADPEGADGRDKI